MPTLHRTTAGCVHAGAALLPDEDGPHRAATARPHVCGWMSGFSRSRGQVDQGWFDPHWHPTVSRYILKPDIKTNFIFISWISSPACLNLIGTKEYVVVVVDRRR